jgi:hypothetical protein
MMALCRIAVSMIRPFRPLPLSHTFPIRLGKSSSIVGLRDRTVAYASHYVVYLSQYIYNKRLKEGKANRPDGKGLIGVVMTRWMIYRRPGTSLADRRLVNVLLSLLTV